MLTDLGLLPVYDSAEKDLVEDLIVPLLEHSDDYLRGVGFFSSGWLRIAARGLTGLIQNGGTAKIVTSPILGKGDWEALQLGSEASQSAALRNILYEHIDSIELGLEKDTLNTLAWLIADGLLEIKFAIPKNLQSDCDYHDKVGVFSDAEGNKVAIHGSFNDSIKGSLNGEAFSVFTSWSEGQIPFIQKHQSRLLQLWESGNSQFDVYPIPQAAKEKFIRLRTSTERPYKAKISNSGEHQPYDTTHDTLKLPFELYPYQLDAIESWCKSNYRGIFDMATGTGKTITSLGACVKAFENIGKLATIILVPYMHLIEQWEEDCVKVGLSPILCSSAHGNWAIEVKSKIQDFNINAIDNLCILAVHDTASSPRFLKAIKQLRPEETLLIGDEAHGLGSGKLRNALTPTADLRLGLSATPRRWFDEEGTSTLMDYFGDVCFEFSLEKAIGKYLTPYEYNPILVNLSEEETERYEELTASIAKHYASKNKKDDKTPDKLKWLLLERASLVSGAENKTLHVLNILQQMQNDAKCNGSEPRHILVYCSPGKHKEVLASISAMGYRCHQFVHEVPLKKRYEVLKQFDRGDIQVLVAVKCLDEGVDVPSTKAAFFLASTSNPREFVQRRGRVLRKAKGKEKALLYDLLVVPREEHLHLKRDIDASLLRREMPRFAEFSSAALNKFEARSIIWDYLNNYEMIDCIDKKPWDVYHEMQEKNEGLND